MENMNTDHKGTTGNDHSGTQPANGPMQKATEVAEEMKSEVGKYVDSAKEYWDEFSEEIRAKGVIAREGVNKAKKYADDYAHENPWKLVGIAAAIGAVAALVISGCSKGNCRRHRGE